MTWQPDYFDGLRDGEAGNVQLRTRIAALEAALEEACNEYDDSAQYKGAFLRDKHCDDETLTRLRAVLRGEDKP